MGWSAIDWSSLLRRVEEGWREARMRARISRSPPPRSPRLSLITSLMTMAPRRRSMRPPRSMALISRDTVSRRVSDARGEFGLVRGSDDDRAFRIVTVRDARGAGGFRVDTRPNIERAEFADPLGHRAKPLDQLRQDRLGERAMGEHRLDEHRSRHFRRRSSW